MYEILKEFYSQRIKIFFVKKRNSDRNGNFFSTPLITLQLLPDIISRTYTKFLLVLYYLKQFLN